jgi:hypothetical protein
MPSVNDSRHQEADEASWEAMRGAVYGAFKWGLPTALLGGLGYAVSPVYRGLTIQFKVYTHSFHFPLPPGLRTGRHCDWAKNRLVK